MRTLFAMTLLALPLSASAQAPMPIIPLNPDLSGVWTLDPAPIPRWTTRPRNCVEALYRRTNFAGYGASYVELHKVGEHLEVAGTFDHKRTMVFDYEGRIFYTQGYLSEVGTSGAINYSCATEPAEYKVSGNSRWGIDDNSFEVNIRGPLDSAVSYAHGVSATFSGYFIDADGKTIHGNIGAGSFVVDSSTYVNPYIVPGNCPIVGIPEYEQFELTSCSVRGGKLRTLRRSDAPDELKGKITGNIVEALGGTRTATVIANAEVMIIDQQAHVTAREPGMSDQVYQRLLRKELLKQAVLAVAHTDVNGNFEVEVPLWKRHAGGKRLDRRAYGVIINHGRRDRLVAGRHESVFYYGWARANLLAPRHLDIALDRVSGLDEKIVVTNQLADACPNQYGPGEEAVRVYVETLANTGNPPEERVEGVQRALMAEHIALPAVGYAESFISLGMDPMITLSTEILKKVVGQKYKPSKAVGDSTEHALEKTAAEFDALQRENPFGSSGLRLAEARAAAAAARKAPGVAAVFLLRNIKALNAALSSALKTALIAAGRSPQDAELISDKEAELNLALAEAALTGDPTELVGVAFKALVEQLKDTLVSFLLDGFGGSYCGLSGFSLAYSATTMQSWATYDPVAYRADMDRAYHEVAASMHETATKELVGLAFMRALANTAATSKDVFEFVPLPATQAVAKAAFVTQLATESGILVSALTKAFVLLPNEVELRARMSFGETPARGMAAGSWIRTSTGVANELTMALSNMDLASERARAAILSGSVGVVIQNMGSPDPALSLPLAMSDLERATDRMMTALLGVRDDERELVKWSMIARGRVMEIQAEAEQVVVGTFDYIDKLMTHTYPSENDPSALRARNTLHTRAASLHNKASRVFESFGAIRSDWRDLDVRPALRVGNLEVSSMTVAGNELRTQSPETFTVHARVENVSTVAVGPLAARLRVRSPAGVAEIVGSAEVAITSLDPDDEVRDTGADEADLSWTVRVNASVDQPGATLLTVELVDAASPRRFEADVALGVIEVDPAVSDVDQDLMPNAWERRMGLDPAVNDAALDADGDGLSNLEEYERGTLANRADSDGDTLSDADELRGTAGRIPTDPLLPDTDGDGVNDNADADPRDVTTSTLARAQGEPAIRLESCAIALSTDRRQPENSAAFVGVENAGTSSLAWTVEGTNLSSALQVLPLAPSVIQGASKISILALGPMDSPVELWVSDVSGNVRDRQRLLVYVDQPLPADPCSGLPSTDGGVAPGMDGSVASDAGGIIMPRADAGAGPGPGPSMMEDPASGCGCSIGSASESCSLLVGLGAAMLVLRRRRR